jgi:hypothetical protein
MSENHIDGLLKGEINFYPSDDGKYLVMEVGGTEKPFAALASDVAAWAKAENKPEYQATEIKGLDAFIAKEIEDTNTEYSIEESNGQIIVKTKDGTNDEAPWEQIGEPIDIITPTELTTILADYVTNVKLLEVLSNYALASDLSSYATITYVDGKIDKVETALAGVKATAEAAAVKTEVEATVAEINNRIDGVKATADAAAVKTEVNSAFETVNGSIDTINNTVNTLTETVNNHYDEMNSAIEELKAADDALDGKITAETTAREEADIALAADIVAAETAAKAYADEIKADLLGNSETLEGTYDTLKEIHGWITKEGVDATDLASAIAGETAAREAADAVLTQADSDLAAAIAKEAEDRAAEDTVLEGKISAETKAREDADLALDGKITAEAEARTQGDSDTLAATKTYTDEEIVKVKAYADQAEADAIATAAEDATAKANAAEANAKAYADSLEHKDTTYTAGTGLKLNGTEFSIDTDLVFILDANA